MAAVKDMFLSLVEIGRNIRTVSRSTALSCRKSKAWQDATNGETGCSVPDLGLLL